MTKGGARNRLFFPGKARKRRMLLMDALKNKTSCKASTSKRQKPAKATKMQKTKKEKKKKDSLHNGRQKNKTRCVPVQRKAKAVRVKKTPSRSVCARTPRAASSGSRSLGKAPKESKKKKVSKEISLIEAAVNDVRRDPRIAENDSVANTFPNKNISVSETTAPEPQHPLHVCNVSAPPQLNDSASLRVCAEPRWFRAAAPLLPTRARKLFGRGECAAAESADAAALFCFFPLTHNGEWFYEPADFLEHCASVSHSLLCESAPCFPMDPLPQMWTEPIALLPRSDAINDAEHSDQEDNVFSDDTELCRARDFWFMRLHSVVTHFFTREFNIFLRNKTACAADMAELRQSAGAFHSAATEALARHLARECGDGTGHAVPELWLSLKETTAAVEAIVSRVYKSQRDPNVECSALEAKGIHALSADVAAAVVESLHNSRGLFVESEDSREECTGSEGGAAPMLEFNEDCEESPISKLTLWLFMQSHAIQ